MRADSLEYDSIDKLNCWHKQGSHIPLQSKVSGESSLPMMWHRIQMIANTTDTEACKNDLSENKTSRPALNSALLLYQGDGPLKIVLDKIVTAF